MCLLSQYKHILPLNYNLLSQSVDFSNTNKAKNRFYLPLLPSFIIFEILS